MASSSFLTRLARQSWRRRLLLAEATAALAVASLAIRLLPFQTVVGALGEGRRAKADPAGDAARIAGCRAAVQAASRYLPWKTVCFQMGLGLHFMLRRRGISSFLHYGVAQLPDRGLAAHVWVSSAGAIVIGGEEAARFACLATFPKLPVRDDGAAGPFVAQGGTKGS